MKKEANRTPYVVPQHVEEGYRLPRNSEPPRGQARRRRQWWRRGITGGVRRRDGGKSRGGVLGCVEEHARAESPHGRVGDRGQAGVDRGFCTSYRWRRGLAWRQARRLRPKMIWGRGGERPGVDQGRRRRLWPGGVDR